MNINIQAHILKIASQMLCEQVTNGNTLVATKVRDNGDILEWHLLNGDMIEIINNKNYETGIVLTPSTSICIYRDNEIVQEELFINPQSKDSQ